jgi:CHRD domain
VSVFFCGGGGKPDCPATTSGSVSGTITAANVIGPASQGVDPGDLAALETAIRAGVAYANMHTMKFPTGEIRGQIKHRHGEDRDDP